jgi:hypothetical protein
MNRALIAFSIVISLSLVACGGKLTQEQQYEKLKNSYKYRAYKALSNKSIPYLLKQYNDRQDTKISQTQFRRALALLWTSSGKHDFAIAECDLALAESKTDVEKHRVYAILAVSLYQKKWDRLGKKTSTEAQKSIRDPGLAKSLYIEKLVTYTAFAFLGIYEGDKNIGVFAFDGLALSLNDKTISEYGRAVMAIRNKEYKEGLSILKTLSKDPRLSPEQRRIIKSVADDITADVEKYSDPVSLMKVITKEFFSYISDQTKKQFDSLMGQFKALQDKISF